MKFIDTHIHIGDFEKVKSIIEHSEYKNVYRLYSAIDSEVIRFQQEYLKQCEKFFAMPIVLKELDIHEENLYVISFCKAFINAIPVLFVGDNVNLYKENKISFLKEHFIFHNAIDWKERKASYEYLNSIGGFIIIHSSDNEREEYIKLLRRNYPKMKIIIAHMGRNVWEEYEFTTSIINAFSNDEMILFDISTITKAEIIEYAIEKISSKRILFASDFPYEFHIGTNVNELAKKIDIIDMSEEERADVFYKNAERLIKLFYA